MPLTEFQIVVLGLLAQHRNPNSYVAGGIAINRLPSSLGGLKYEKITREEAKMVSCQQ